jgi:hypothetical protein
MLAGTTACWHNSTMHDLRSYGMLASGTSVSISACLAFLTLEKSDTPITPFWLLALIGLATIE